MGNLKTLGIRRADTGDEALLKELVVKIMVVQ
jgi:hypothetical protein